MTPVRTSAGKNHPLSALKGVDLIQRFNITSSGDKNTAKSVLEIKRLQG